MFHLAPRPKRFDDAYFSEVPKLIAVFNQPGKPLGLTIKNAEVGNDEFVAYGKGPTMSCFRDTLIKVWNY